ncbi:MAG: murein biosynthesis integral membrane protein MurJ [Bacillota bacterium]|nr:murein biosynthesis integral membrane protein MurJ [Bacillota bacterium]MDW7678457.1 murein biosynthesis integral membrane protein MurJ [Bacillota bacterium]
MSRFAKVGASTFFIVLFSLGGKLLGFIREVLIASKFGSGIETDAYFIALTATGIATMLLWTAINTTLVPIFSEVEHKEGEDKKIFHANNMINVILIISAIITLVGWIAAPLLVRLIAIGFEGQQFELAVAMTRIGFPKLLFTGAIGVLSAFLHSEGKFKSASSIYIFSSLVTITYLLFFSAKFGILGLMVASLFAVAVQLPVLLPEAIKSKYKYQFVLDIKDKYIHKLGYLVFPVLLGTAINEINIIVDRTIASSLVSGSISSLTYASKLNNLILGVFITAITTVIFPILSKESNTGNTDGLKRIMGYGINLILLISIPAAVGLILLAKPIVEIAFQRGQFDASATIMTSAALIFYSLGLVSMALRLLITRVYYSLQDTKTPTINSAIAVAFNIVLNLILVRFMAYAGLALATSIATTIATFLMFIGLRKKIGTLGLKSSVICGLKATFAAMIMGAFSYFSYYGLYNALGYGKVNSLISFAVAAGLGALLYGLLCYVFGTEEVKIVVDKALKKVYY